jgi:SnoaL-like protein
MTADPTLDTVRAYHQAWTSKNFDAAIKLLSPQLHVEVPMNDYPTKDSFAQALTGFGSIVTNVELLSEMSLGNEAMLLYDLDAEQLGTLRVAEHFTINDGTITRLRQIHDTAPVRAAGFAPSEMR